MVNPIRDKGKPAAAFGSYGWSGEAIKIIEENLKVLKFKTLQEGVGAKFYPNNEKSKQLIEYGQAFGKLVLEA